MRTTRLEAFSDGVLAIVITIMVLELHDPDGSGWHDLARTLPTVVIYLLSFVYVGIYWANHHHLLATTHRVTGRLLWANLHLLFWLSLLPWTTAWLGSSDFAAVPAVVYGFSLLTAAVAYFVLQRVIINDQGVGSLLAAAIGSDWKGRLSPVLYAIGITLAFLDIVPAAIAFYAVVALLWIVPDRRLEARLSAQT